MNPFDKRNMQAWSSEIRKHVMLYPNERVVAFLARYYGDIANNRNQTALDLGFGSGRHLKLLLDYGFQTYGIDYSKECLETATRVLGEHAHLANLKNDEIETVEFDTLFDVVINLGFIFNKTLDRMLADLKKINAMMKPGGRMFVNFRTTEDHLYGNGKKIDQRSYVIGPGNGPYSETLYTFLTDEEAQLLLNKAGFDVENTERCDHWKNGLSEHHSWWLYSVRKG